MGSNRVMAVALGQTEEAAYRDNLQQVAARLTGNVGLFMTNRKPEEVANYFETYTPTDYARTGNVASQTITLNEGPVKFAESDENVAHSLEPLLRKLGMPTNLKNGTSAEFAGGCA